MEDVGDSVGGLDGGKRLGGREPAWEWKGRKGKIMSGQKDIINVRKSADHHAGVFGLSEI